MKDELGTRMKEFYESVPKTRLVRRIPVAIRIDGKAFHTFTKGFNKPFDEILIRSMQETMRYLCKNIQGCVFGYTQSDEITLILIDYQNLNTAAWFDYEIQKMCSISASMATMIFNKLFFKNAENYIQDCAIDYETQGLYEKDSPEYDICNIYRKAIKNGAMFDSRCFNIPKEEVANLIYWRQLDAMRNSIQMVGQANFSHKELQGKSCNEIKDMLNEKKSINWDELPAYQKQGSCCIKKDSGWIIDTLIPIFKGENRSYINDLIFI